MVIDLEHCRNLNSRPPQDLQMRAWVAGTLNQQGRYTEESDMFLIGNLVDELLRRPCSFAAMDFVSQLKAKTCSATAALQHAWFALEQDP